MSSTILAPAPDRTGDLPPFLVSIDVVAGRVSLHGELDARHVDRLLESVAVLACSGAPTWSIDVDGLTFCDVAGLRGLLAARELAQQAGRSLSLARCRTWLQELVRLAGLDDLLPPSPAAPEPRSGTDRC